MTKSLKLDRLQLGVCYYPEHWPEDSWRSRLWSSWAAPPAPSSRAAARLQDIDQAALFEPHVKWLATVDTVRGSGRGGRAGFRRSAARGAGAGFSSNARSTCSTKRSWCAGSTEWGGGAAAALLRREGRSAPTCAGTSARLFGGRPRQALLAPQPMPVPQATGFELKRAVAAVRRRSGRCWWWAARRWCAAARVGEIAAAIERARRAHLPLRHGPRPASAPARRCSCATTAKTRSKEADLVILAGVPSDFRLDYGRHVSRGAQLVSFNLSGLDLVKNRKPDLAILADPGLSLIALAAGAGKVERPEWLAKLREPRRRA